LLVILVLPVLETGYRIGGPAGDCKRAVKSAKVVAGSWNTLSSGICTR